MDLLEYYKTYETELRSRKSMANFKGFLQLDKYEYSCLKDYVSRIDGEGNGNGNIDKVKKCTELFKIAIILDICYEIYEDYLNYSNDDTIKHLFYLVFSTELVRDFNSSINKIVSDTEERIKIFDKFSNRVDYEKENIFKHILDYINR